MNSHEEKNARLLKLVEDIWTEARDGMSRYYTFHESALENILSLIYDFEEEERRVVEEGCGS